MWSLIRLKVKGLAQKVYKVLTLLEVLIGLMSCSGFSNFELVHDITNKDGKWWVVDFSTNKLWFSWKLSKTRSVKIKTNSLESKSSDSLKIFNKTLSIFFGVQITNILDKLAAFTKIVSREDLKSTTLNVWWANISLLPVAAGGKLMVRDVDVSVSSHHVPNLLKSRGLYKIQHR